jgi:class 3 adenylate cyclase/tetratricopeptide (TPR) repeat protein
VRTGTDGSVRVVTVLFADMVGSVEHTAAIDPEAAAELVQRIVNAMTTAVLDHGGDVDRLLGDGLFALFGARRAAEDAPERAVRAGFQLCAAVHALGQEATVGINTGSAYLGPVGSDTYAEHTAMGSTVNLAARLRAAAAPGEVLVGRSTRAATRGRVDYESRTVDVKGVGTVEAFRAAGLQTGKRLRGFEGRTTEIIGRATEQRMLADALDDLHQDHGGIVFVVGEPGLGKTRLVDELAERSRTLGIRTVQARCEESNSASYGVWAEALRQIRATSDTSISTSVDVLFLTGEAADADADALTDLGPAALRNRLLRSLEQLWLDVANERPTLLVLEDLHWADRLSLAVVERVIAHVAECPLLVVATQRPDTDQPSAELPERANVLAPEQLRVLRLRELPPFEAHRLLARLLERDEAVDIAATLGVERAQGNPLFLEELVAAAVDAGLLEPASNGWALSAAATTRDPTALEVPDTLQTIVLSRVDRLTPELQQQLRTASVLGRTFFVDELEEMVDGDPLLLPHLDELEERGLVFRDDTRTEPAFSFKHALVHETIYTSILRRHRGPLHRAAALAIERCRGVDVAVDRLAQQWDATTDDAAAFTALSRAAAAAHRTFQLDAALDFLDRASARVGRLDLPTDALVDLDERRGDLMELAGRHQTARNSYTAAMNSLDPAARLVSARLRRKEAHCWTIEHDYDEAARAYAEAAQLLDQIADRGDDWWHERLQIVVDEARMNYWRSGTDRMAELDKAFDADITAHGSARQIADHLTARMMRWMRTGRYAIDDDCLQLARRVARRSADDPDLAHRSFMVFNYGFTLLLRRDLDAAHDVLTQSLELAQRAGDVITQSRIHTYLAVWARFAGDAEACRSHTDVALAAAAAGGMTEYDGAGRGNLAWLARRVGAHDEAERLAREAIELWQPLELVYGFQWTARMPLLAVLTERGDLTEAGQQAVAMNDVHQQVLTSPLMPLLEAAQTGSRVALAELVRAGTPLGYC